LTVVSAPGNQLVQKIGYIGALRPISIFSANDPPALILGANSRAKYRCTDDQNGQHDQELSISICKIHWISSVAVTRRPLDLLYRHVLVVRIAKAKAVVVKVHKNSAPLGRWRREARFLAWMALAGLSTNDCARSE